MQSCTPRSGPRPCVRPVPGPPWDTFLWFSWLHPLKDWSLRETRGGSVLNAPDFLEEIVRSEAAGDPGGGDSSPATKEARRRSGGPGGLPRVLIVNRIRDVFAASDLPPPRTGSVCAPPTAGAPKPGDQETEKRGPHLPRRGGLPASGDRPGRGDE